MRIDQLAKMGPVGPAQIDPFEIKSSSARSRALPLLQDFLKQTKRKNVPCNFQLTYESYAILRVSKVLSVDETLRWEIRNEHEQRLSESRNKGLCFL